MANHSYLFSDKLPKTPEELHTVVASALHHPRFCDSLRAHLVEEDGDAYVFVLPKSIQDPRASCPLRLELCLGKKWDWTDGEPAGTDQPVPSTDRRSYMGSDQTSRPCIDTRHGHESSLAWHFDHLLSMCLLQRLGGKLYDDGAGVLPLVDPDTIRGPYGPRYSGLMGKLAGYMGRKADERLLKDYAELRPFFERRPETQAKAVKPGLEV